MSQYRTLIFPNIAALSTEQCKQISDFVERGGSIIATYETSLYDEWGVRRKDFGLASLFGASTMRARRKARCKTPISSLKKDPATGQYHPLLAGFEDAGRIINTIRRVHVTPIDARPVFSLDTDSDLSRPSHGRVFPAERNHT